MRIADVTIFAQKIRDINFFDTKEYCKLISRKFHQFGKINVKFPFT